MALKAIEGRLAWGERLGVIFTGVSLGSILLLVALGLAITYGLMGVINMAHGELMMIGAYATYLMQNLFKAYLPGAFDAYMLVAVPMSFLAAALVGAALERSVIRWLYGRPLETLLATWGISLMLQQAVRSIFGAQNVPVENPAWLSGGVDVMSNLTLPFNRIAIIAFALLVLVGVWALITRTRLGLFVRGVTQNRRMAACMGVDTARIDTYAFALGSGIAGLAGCALSQVGNVGPDLGQGYIVDSFMVVVLGGVGQLAGTVYAALGLGVLNKLLEGLSGAVLAKIMVLVLIVVFIQKRPQGIFALKGRELPKPGHEAPPAACKAVGYWAHGLECWSRVHRAMAVWSGALAQPGRAGRQRPAPVRLLRQPARQDPVLRDLRAGDGPDLGLHRHPVARPRPVLRARWLCHGHVPDAPDRQRRPVPPAHARLHGLPELEDLPLALGAQRQLCRRRCCWCCWCRACWPSSSATSPFARASRACTSRSSRRR